MAPKRKINEKSRFSYDLSRFVSVAAAERYENALNVVVRNYIPELGLDFSEHNVPAIVSYIEKRGWGKFYKEPFDDVDCVVREFYANALE